MEWQVFFSGQAKRQLAKLSQEIREIVRLLVYDMETRGPIRKNWRNYSPIQGSKNTHHCHLNSGRPCYVVIWKVTDKSKRVIEICFVGAHGSVNYDRYK